MQSTYFLAGFHFVKLPTISGLWIYDKNIDGYIYNAVFCFKVYVALYRDSSEDFNLYILKIPRIIG